ncbi:hypothetical protein D3C73_894250 [compost metagenome]
MMISVAGTSVFINRMVPAVARMGPPVRALTCVPVAKISRAISGRALFLKRAVVKPPMASASGAKVPIREPRISGTSINPPGIFCMVPKKGEREEAVVDTCVSLQDGSGGLQTFVGASVSGG